jgi:hypothetical protein
MTLTSVWWRPAVVTFAATLRFVAPTPSGVDA